MAKTFDTAGLYIRDIFRIGGPMGSTDGRAEFLNWDNCKITNRSLADNGLILHLERESDGEEGRASIKLKDEFDASTGLVKKVFLSKNIEGLTLNGFKDLKVNAL